MMYLKDEGIDLIEKDYKKKIIPDIKGAFIREKLGFPADFLATLTKWGILTSRETLNDSFLEDLLSLPIEELAAPWNWVGM